MAKRKPKQNQVARYIAMVMGCLLLFLLLQTLGTPPKDTKQISYSEFIEATKLPEENQKRVMEVTIHERGLYEGKFLNKKEFKTQGPIEGNPELGEKLAKQNIKVVHSEPDTRGFWESLLIQSLPILLLLFVVFFFMRQLQVGGGKAMSFGKSRARLHESDKKVTFKDVAGIEEAKEEVQEIIDFLKDPKKFTKLGARIPKGVLLMGPPGTGKTILAKAIAGEAGVPFYTISGSDFVEMFVGVGASRVRDLFEQAKKSSPCIIFIDEIDAVGRHRGAGLGGGHDEREQTLNQLLVEMDGFEANEGVILIAATNRPDVLDPALLRPGRFDRRVTVPRPDMRGRAGILGVHTRKKPIEKGVDLTKIAKGTPGFSGADLENLVNEAALIAARSNVETISEQHLELAKDKVLMGPERRSMVMSETEKLNTAYHEAGHCIVAKKVPGADPVHKITIIPRGQALGVTILLPNEDKLTLSKENAEGVIQFAMGGKAAEAVVFGRQTTGAGDDLKKATGIARKMVCNWGMSEKVGPISLSKEGGEVFLGREMSQSRPYSEKVAEMIDEEVRDILTRSYKRAEEILQENRDILDNMARALVVSESLNSKEINRLMTGEVLTTKVEFDAHMKAAEEKMKEPEEAQTLDVAARKDSKEDSSDDVAAASNLGEPVPQGT